MKLNYIACLLIVINFAYGYSQEPADSSECVKEFKDSLFIAETENIKGEDKVLHAEPLFIDLIRDLGARKGEKEWNIGVGMTDRKTYDSYSALVEYEFAPIDRLGLEVELPFTFYYPTDSSTNFQNIPQSRLNSLKVAAQYSFYVNKKISTSLALGYINEFEFTSFNNYGVKRFIEGNIFNPFVVAAKRWGANFHTLIYSGPLFILHFGENELRNLWQINTNLHYLIPGSRNFVGIEFNKDVTQRDFDMTIRPQMRVALSDNLLIGIVTGIPIQRENQRFSTFMRLIYEPKHRPHEDRSL